MFLLAQQQISVVLEENKKNHVAFPSKIVALSAQLASFGGLHGFVIIFLFVSDDEQKFFAILQIVVALGSLFPLNCFSVEGYESQI